MHAQSGGTGDAAELTARWGPQGRFEGGYNNLSTLAGEFAAIKETHHFYPVLFYFRFEDAFYAPSRMLLIALDAAALVRTVLDPRELGWLQRSAALLVEGIERGGPPELDRAEADRVVERRELLVVQVGRRRDDQRLNLAVALHQLQEHASRECHELRVARGFGQNGAIVSGESPPWQEDGKK